MGDWERQRLVADAPRVRMHDHDDVAVVLVTVKAYPAIGKKTGEAVCVAGVRLDGDAPEWIRLFPVRFRELPRDRQFQKYQVISLKLLASPSDRRPESRKPDLDSMRVGKVLPPGRSWATRRAVLEPLLGGTTTCELLAGARELGGSAPSLGLVAATVLDLKIETNPAFARDTDTRAEVDLFGEVRDPLEHSPVVAKYRYRCASEGCPTHLQTLVDWESGRLARRNMGLGDAEMIRLHRQRFLDEICGPQRDAHFYVGNMHRHPTDFLVLGVWSPPGTAGSQGTLGL